LIKAAGFGANFLLNIGPKPDGSIQPEFVKSLKAIGEWLEINGEAIKGKSKGFQKPNEYLVITQKGNKVYLHLLEKSESLALQIPFEVKFAKTYVGKSSLTFKNAGLDNFYIIDLKNVPFNEIDTIIELEIY
jgi:alpha-L-fucosidase